MEQHALEAQDEVWVFTDDDNSRSEWLRGVITATSTSSIDVRVTRGQTKEVLKGVLWDHVIKYQALAERGIPNALDASPEEFSEVFMVETLRQRFNSALPSMRAGPYLVSLRGDCVQGLDKDPEFFARPKNEERPDAVLTAQATYNKCISEGVAQTIIVTGVSGSGKSWTAKQSLSTLASCGVRGAVSSQVVQETLAAAVTVLDAFSNAATTMNEDSSRSTRGYSLLYDAKGSLLGAKVTNMHLDVGRLTRKPTGEGPFHILLQLVHGVWPQERDKLQLRSVNEYKLLENSPRSSQSLQQHANGYSDTRDAMSKIGMSMAEQTQLMFVVSGLLALGNVSFTGSACEPYNKEAFENSAELLGVSYNDLLSAFAEQKVSYGQRSMSNKRRPEAASALVPMVLEFLYSALFEYLIEKVNNALQPYEQPANLINVVDPSGFERLGCNTFDQFCVNYLDESLKFALIRRLFCLDLGASNESLEQEQLLMYLEQSQKSKSQVEKDLLPDQLTIQLFDGPGGLMELFDAESKAPNGSSATMAQRIFQSQEPAIKKLVSRPDPTQEHNGLYAIQHSMGMVTYHEQDALAPNMRTVPAALRTLLATSTHRCMNKIVSIGSKELENGSVTVIGALSNRLQRWVQGLDQLAAVSPAASEYLAVICCVRPNLTTKPDSFDAAAVLQQLRAWQVCQAVHFRQIFSDNVVVAPVFTSKWTSMDSKMGDEAKQSAMVAAFSTQNLHGGSETDKMQSSQNNILKWLQNVDHTRAALKIQSAYRRWLVRLKYRRLGTLFEKVQKEIRRVIILQRYGNDLKHDQQQQIIKQIAESVSQDQANREAKKHEQLMASPDFLSPEEIHARRIQDIINLNKQRKDQGLLVSQRHRQEDVREVSRQPSYSSSPVYEEHDEHSRFGDGFDQDYDYDEKFAHAYLKEQPFSGTSGLAQALKRSIGEDLKAMEGGMAPLHKTLPSSRDYYVPKPEKPMASRESRVEQLIQRESRGATPMSNKGEPGPTPDLSLIHISEPTRPY
eukprot:TRINITY_DN1866_c0_g2_i2.p1 TRINITY_DN1866_c0_g2~~TRINITY_DN1866_c0_g2_i2.p1  ORF type:complete len:1016 (+),score=273.52 TRINITY_DN1866_c0_g2_i2:226-3273(+)